jgi:hypothetical protein
LSDTTGLQDEERDALFRLLSQHIARKPGEIGGYNAYRLLVEKDIAGAADRLAQAVMSVPSDAIPAAVGMDLLNLSGAKAEITAILAPALARLAESGSRAGAAAKSGKSTHRKN